MERNINSALTVLREELEILNEAIYQLEINVAEVSKPSLKGEANPKEEPEYGNLSPVARSIIGMAENVKNKRLRIQEVVDLLDLTDNEPAHPVDSPMVHATVPRR